MPSCKHQTETVLPAVSLGPGDKDRMDGFMDGMHGTAQKWPLFEVLLCPVVSLLVIDGAPYTGPLVARFAGTIILPICIGIASSLALFFALLPERSFLYLQRHQI
jgi:hypothetical protein